MRAPKLLQRRRLAASGPSPSGDEACCWLLHRTVIRCRSLRTANASCCQLRQRAPSGSMCVLSASVLRCQSAIPSMRCLTSTGTGVRHLNGSRSTRCRKGIWSCNQPLVEPRRRTCAVLGSRALERVHSWSLSLRVEGHTHAVQERFLVMQSATDRATQSEGSGRLRPHAALILDSSCGESTSSAQVDRAREGSSDIFCILLEVRILHHSSSGGTTRW
jgi:hypothetical protein